MDCLHTVDLTEITCWCQLTAALILFVVWCHCYKSATSTRVNVFFLPVHKHIRSLLILTLCRKSPLFWNPVTYYCIWIERERIVGKSSAGFDIEPSFTNFKCRWELRNSVKERASAGLLATETKQKSNLSSTHYENSALPNATTISSLTATVSGLFLVTSCQAAVRGVHFLFLWFSLLARTCVAVHLCLFYCIRGGGVGGGSALCCLQVTVLLGLLAVTKEGGPAFESLLPLAGRLLHLSRQRPQQSSQWYSNAGSHVLTGTGSSPQSRFQKLWVLWLSA